MSGNVTPFVQGYNSPSGTPNPYTSGQLEWGWWNDGQNYQIRGIPPLVIAISEETAFDYDENGDMMPKIDYVSDPFFILSDPNTLSP